MIVKLFDRTEIAISKAEADVLAKSLNRSNDGMVTIKGNLIRKSAIAAIMQGGYTEPDIRAVNDPNKRLRSDNRSDDDQYKAARQASDVARSLLKKRGLAR